VNDHRRVEEALRSAAGSEVDDEARERSWRVVEAAYASHRPARRRRRWAAVALIAGLIPVAAAGVAAASAPNTGVGRWVRHALGAGRSRAEPALVRIPGGGRLLVEAGGGAWVVAADGTKRRLGTYAGAAWSPGGRFVAAWGGGELAAVDPRGGVRWSLARPGPIGAARWAPVDGFRVSYVEGDALRIVNGDGTGDHRYAATDPGVTPAWRPDRAHVLAYADPGGRRLVVGAVDSGRVLWRSGRLPGIRELVWSPDGTRLLAVSAGGVVLYDGRGRRLASGPTPAGTAVTGATWAPVGGTIALVREATSGARSELVLVTPGRRLDARLVFSGPGRFGAPSWSPDGTRLLLPWPDADQWLFLRPGSPARVAAVANIAGQFGPGETHPAFPRSARWCCTVG
jgi:hypothetical protein